MGADGLPGEPQNEAPGSTPGLSRRLRIASITLGLAGVGLAVAAFESPNQLFERFAVMDSGGELAIQDLIRRGFRPDVDFGYPYGLLSLLAGRGWYALAGLSPGSFNGYVAACMGFSCWGLARLAVDRRVGVVGLALITLAMVDLTAVTVITSTHVIEQALLINALAEQARGRRGAALALLTACVFVKPSLAFVQGFVVLVAALVAWWRAGRPALPRAVIPPLITGLVLAVLLAAIFGPSSLARTLSPARGASIYRVNGYGFFFGQGREFWALPGAGLRDYFRYEVGFWALGTLVLLAGGIAGAWRLARGASGDEAAGDDEIVATAAAVHVGFVCLLFGHRWTWVYSLPLLILGLAVLARRGPRLRWVVAGLAVLLLVSDRSKGVAMLARWRVETPAASTLGLWARPEERAEWERALELTQGQHPVLFGTCEGAAVLFPELAPPTAGYLVPGNMIAVEVDRKARQIAAASMIIAYHLPDPDRFEHWPRINAAFAGAEPIFQGKYLKVYRRPRASAAP